MVQTKSKKILVVDDSELFRGALSTSLQSLGYEVSLAPNGKIAKELIGVQPFDAVISDIQMTPVGGLELLNFIKQVRPMPVILMTGFSELMETQEAIGKGVDGFLAKPFKIEEVSRILDSFWVGEGEVLEGEEAPSQDEEYCKLNIDDFVSGKEIKYDIFVRLSERKYIKVAHQGENISAEQISLYKRKGLSHLYMLKEDFKKYVGFNIALSQVLKKSDKISKQKKLNFMKHTSEVLMEHIFLNGIQKEDFDNSKLVVETTLSILSDSEDFFDLLSMLNTHSDSLYAHSLGVSTYAVMIARKAHWISPATLTKVAMCGLFHDIGKKEIDPAVLKKTRQQMTRDEIKVYESHAQRGMEILSEIRSVPSDVLQTVIQHHENCTGTGFPSGLRRARIHPFARLISVASEFCHLVVPGKDEPVMPAPQAVQRLFAIYAETLDPNMLAALAKIFNIPVPDSIASRLVG